MVWKPKDFRVLLALSSCGRFYRRRFRRFLAHRLPLSKKRIGRRPSNSNLLRRRDGFGRGECRRFRKMV